MRGVMTHCRRSGHVLDSTAREMSDDLSDIPKHSGAWGIDAVPEYIVA